MRAHRKIHLTVQNSLLSVGEVAHRLGVSADVVRSLTEGGQLRALRTPGGHRRYRLEEIRLCESRLRAMADRPAAEPTRRHRGFAFQPEYDPFARKLAAEREVEREREKRARAEAERRRLEDLKRYGLAVLRSRAIPDSWPPSIIKEIDVFVTSKRLPSWLDDTEAKRQVAEKVDVVIAEYRKAEDKRLIRQIRAIWRDLGRA